MSDTATTATGAATRPWVVPASYAQERVWFASQFATGSPVYHVQDRIPLPYPLDAERLIGALAEVVDRHETLRTAFRLDEGTLMQVVHHRLEALPVEVVGLGGEQDVDRRIDELGGQLLARPLPLHEPPLWRAQLLRTAERDWVLVFVAHHAVMDAASLTNLRAELDELCAAAVQGRAAKLPDLPIQYGDFAVWQRDRLEGEARAGLAAYWREVLADLPAVHGLPTDRPRPPHRSFTGTEIVFELPPGTADALPAVARDAGATPFMVLLAAYVATLHGLSGQRDVVVGVPVAGRDLPELQPLIGMFVNLVVLRTRLSGEETFAQLVRTVRHTALGAFEHQEMPFQKLVESHGHREPGIAPLYQLGFNHLPAGVNSQDGIAEDDLMLEIDTRRGRLEYSTALFDQDTAREIVQSFQRVLATVLADPAARLADLPVTPLRSTPAAAPAVRPAGEQPGPNGSGAAEYVEPRTAAEELVAQVWQEVLGAERVGATDDFFALGGHSLLALRVIARLSAATEISLPIQAFFADTTVAGVAAEVERLLAEEIDALSEEEALHQLGENA